MAVNSEIYIDKTNMIQYLNSVVNTNQRFVSVSRPRRFGKSMAADMICAYYDREADSRELFLQRELAKCQPVQKDNEGICWDTYLGKFDVLRVTMTDFIKDSNSVSEMLNNLNREVSEELMDEFQNVKFNESPELRKALSRIYGKNKRQFVIVIDEWDVVFRKYKFNEKDQEIYLDFLRDLLKDKPYVALAYITGILPIKKHGEHSALNMFDEYSMTQPMQLAEYTGFTEEEVRFLCEKYEMGYEDVSKWYDGYRLSEYIPLGKREQFRKGNYDKHKLSIYSPHSVVKAMRSGFVDNFWNKTETYEALADYIRKDYDGLKQAVVLLMDGARLHVNLKTYQNDMTTFNGRDDILALLIHLGYLGFEGDEEEGRINSEEGEVFIPNCEIMEVFKTSTEENEWEGTFKTFELSKDLLKATWEKKEEKIAKILERFHNQTGNKTYNDEAALSYAIQLAYYAAQKYYTTVLELDTGKGYADVVYLPAPKYSDKPALLIELKYEKNADTAIAQIKRQEYPERLLHYKGNLLLIGINYDKDVDSKSPDFKRHTCVIEEA